MNSPKIKISVAERDYFGIYTLASGVIISMTGNANFPSPAPSLATLQTTNDALSTATTAWGTPGHRGSHIDLVRLRAAAIDMRKLLFMEASYVVGLVDPNASPTEQQAFILSSGFAVKKERTPQGVLAAPQNLHQVIHKRFSPYTPKLRCAKPQGLNCRFNVKLYFFYRSATWNFFDSVKIGESTNTSFIDMTAPRGTTQYYFVAGYNAAGLGVVSDGIEVLIPN